MRRIDKSLIDAMICAQLAYYDLRACVLEENAEPYGEAFQFVGDAQTFASIAKAVGADVRQCSDGTEQFTYNKCVFVHRRDRVEVA